jgi:hypothetical protein
MLYRTAHLPRRFLQSSCRTLTHAADESQKPLSAVSGTNLRETHRQLRRRIGHGARGSSDGSVPNVAASAKLAVFAGHKKAIRLVRSDRWATRRAGEPGGRCTPEPEESGAEVFSYCGMVSVLGEEKWGNARGMRRARRLSVSIDLGKLVSAAIRFRTWRATEEAP